MSRVSAGGRSTVMTNITQQIVLRVSVLVRYARLYKLCHVKGDGEVHDCGVFLHKKPVLRESAGK